MKGWVYNILNALDRLGCAILGWNPDYTISYRLAIEQKAATWWPRWPACQICKLLNFYEPDHCNKAIISTKAKWKALAEETARGVDPT